MEYIIVLIVIGFIYLSSKGQTIAVVPSGSAPFPYTNVPSPLSNIQTLTISSPSITQPQAQQNIIPYLKAGAQLLDDNTIATHESLINFKTSDRSRFVAQCLVMLSAEQITGGVTSTALAKCASGGTYQGPPLALSVLKDGGFALSTVSAFGGALGGAIGSVGGLAGTGFAAAGTLLGTAIPIIGIGIGAAISIFSTIAAHHAAAVRNEQGLECNLIPPANYALNIIEQAVVTGTITVQMGQASLDKLLSDFKAAALDGSSGQLEDNPGNVNAMGWYYHFLHCIITKKQNRYANLVG